jgi:murein DD-endopeptidase MepM/ murein hydrolase activator NlpD
MSASYEIFWPFDLSTVTEWAGSVRAGGVVHMGTDFGIPSGTPLLATVSGRIVRINNDGLGAYVLDIVRADGLVVRNAHLSRMDVNTGDIVQAGQVIGSTGGIPGTPGAGNTNGAHLHWELRWDRLWQGGSWFDPRSVTVNKFTNSGTQVLASREKQMLIIRHVERDKYFAVGQQYLRHLSFSPHAVWMAGHLNQGGTILDINNSGVGALDVNAILNTFSIPTSVWSTLGPDQSWSAVDAKTVAVDSAALAASVASAVGNVNVNVDALAAAIASKLGAPGSEPITKAAIQSAIEANYKESK